MQSDVILVGPGWSRTIASSHGVQTAGADRGCVCRLELLARGGLLRRGAGERDLHPSLARASLEHSAPPPPPPVEGAPWDLLAAWIRRRSRLDSGFSPAFGPGRACRCDTLGGYRRMLRLHASPVPLPPARGRAWRSPAGSTSRGDPGSRRCSGSSSSISRSFFASGPSGSPVPTAPCVLSWSA